MELTLKPHAVVAVIVGFCIPGALFTINKRGVVLDQSLSSAVVQTQHTTEPVLPTTIGS